MSKSIAIKQLGVVFLLLNSIFLIYGQESKNLISNSRIKILQEIYNEDVELYRQDFLKLEKEFLGNNDKIALSQLYFSHSENISHQENRDSLSNLLHAIIGLNPKSKNAILLPVYLQLASVFHSKGKLDSLVYYQDLAKKLVNENSPYYGQYLLNQALISSENSDHKKAIELIFEAVELFESNQDLGKLAIAYNNLAFNYERLGDFDTHIRYLEKAVAINKKLENTYYLIMNYNNLGSSHRQKDLLDKAIAYYDTAFIYLKKLYNPLQMAQNLLNRANIYKRKGDLEVAEPIYEQSLAICVENKIPYGELLSKINLGDLYRQKKEFEKSKVILDSAFKLSLSLKAKREEALIYEKQAWLARDLADFDTAYFLLDKYHLLNDSLVNESVRKEANALREKYEVGKKENEILNLSKQKLVQQLVIAGMTIGLLGAIILLQGWRTKHKLLKEENQKQALRRKHLREILENKDKELTAQAAQLIQMQQLLETTKTNVIEILSGTSLEQAKVKKIKTALSKNSVLEVKSDFDLRITESNKDFFNVLLRAYPDLKPAELKLCAYLRLNLSTKEIAEITNKSIRTVENTRQSIRKKMDLEGSESLVSHLIALEFNQN